jgi:hypothetical protein
MNQQNLSSFIWSVADLLRGDYKQSEYGKVILPLTVLRRLDCVLEPTKAAVLKEKEKREAAGLNPEPFLLKKSKQLFYNTSPLDIKKLMGDQDNIRENLFSYVQAFSPEVRDIFECFDFHTQVERLAKANLLYLVTEKFANIDLHPEVVTNAQMGSVFEELIRKFAELSNETAGEHFTPREVIRLMVNLLFIEDDDALTKPGIVRSLYDPTGGTGGMLSVADEHLSGLNPDARLVMYGQELNAESYAICKADMLIKGQDISNIIHGNTLSDDGLSGKQFDYMLSNPPFGVEWKKIKKEITKEHEQEGFNGRFGPGLPRVSDGSLLFLMHLISKMRPTKDGGSRFGTLLPLLQAAYDAAPEGAETVITLSRNNLHRAFHEVIRNAGLLAWPDLFQTLRRSCETDFARTCPQHAVSTWIGHSMRVSEKHYLQMTDDLYDLATGRAAESAAAGHGTDSHDAAEANSDHAGRNKKTSQTPLIATECEVLLSEAEGTRTPNHRIDSPVL